MDKIISSHEFGAKLIEAMGFDLKTAHISRIIIDVKSDDVVKIYLVKIGSETLLSLPWYELIGAGLTEIKEVK